MAISRFRRVASHIPSSALAALVIGVALVSATGCVSRSAYDALVADYEWQQAERMRLEHEAVERELEATVQQDRIVDLETSNVALTDSQVAIESELARAYADVRELDSEREQLADLADRRAADLERLQGTYAALVRELAPEIGRGEIDVDALQVGLRISLSDALLFESGSVALNAKGREALERIGGEIAAVPDVIEVEGHTDDVPISDRLLGRFPTNWELAGARSARVARLLIEAGADADRVAAVSYGEHRPVASNDAANGRARNRRIEIRLIPRSAEESMGESAIAALLTTDTGATSASADTPDTPDASDTSDAIDAIGAEIAAMLERTERAEGARTDAPAGSVATEAASASPPSAVSTEPPAKAAEADADAKIADDEKAPKSSEKPKRKPKKPVAPMDLPDTQPVETHDAY